MANYLLVNTFIFLTCVLGYFLLRKAPARFQFYICIFSLSCWMIPWFIFKTPEITHPDKHSLILSQAVNLADHAEQFIISYSLNLNAGWFFVLSSLGLALYFIDVHNAIHTHRKKHTHSHKFNSPILNNHLKGIDVRIGNFCSIGSVSGGFKPTIWIDKTALQSSDNIRLILIHELIHIQQKDHLWIWWITLIERLFWWNPLIFIATNQARKTMELSCDEACVKNGYVNAYAIHLAKLFLDNPQVKNHAYLQLNIQFYKNFNIRRIENLTNKKPSKHWHKILLFLVFFVGCGSGLTAISKHQRIYLEEPCHCSKDAIAGFNCNGNEDKRHINAI